MTADRRNPYVLLGVPFSASADEAQAAFARKARGLRRQPDGAEKLHELTWALNQVTEILRRPELALHVFRIPSDSTVFEASGYGVFNPRPERLERQHNGSEEAWARLLEQVRGEAAAGLVATVAEQVELPPR